MSVSLARWRAVVRLELVTQRREPMTALYILVFGLLAAAFTAGGPVELVRNRGDVPRDAAWSMLLASTALTAFGQVITTMVAATVVLRDEQDRVASLLAATRLTRLEYLLGKLVAALLILVLIYTAIPAGLVIGAIVAGASVSAALSACLPPFVILVLPTMLAVGALQFATGVLSGRLWVIVAQGLMLIWFWSACADAALSTSTGVVASWLDPFGSTAVLRETARWSDTERASRAMPITSALIGSRLLWLLVGSAAACAAVMRGPRRAVRAQSLVAKVEPLPIRARRALRRGARTPPLYVLRATTIYTATWMLRDAGWRVLAALGAINVGVHAFLHARGSTVGADTTAIALRALHVDARLFLILLATIYAGELVWRERDDRSAPLFDAVPAGDGELLVGRVVGVVAAQCLLVFVLSVVAALCAAVSGHGSIRVAGYVTAVANSVLLPFIAWMLLALSVHVLLQQKVVAHLVCIAAWMLAVVTSTIDAAPTKGDVLSRSWLVATALALLVSWLGWVRGERLAASSRYHAAVQRVELL